MVVKFIKLRNKKFIFSIIGLTVAVLVFGVSYYVVHHQSDDSVITGQHDATAPAQAPAKAEKPVQPENKNTEPPKPQPRPTSPQPITPPAPDTPKNPYPYGSAAWYVFGRRQVLGTPMPDQKQGYGDGRYYCYQIKNTTPVTPVPSKYAIGCVPTSSGGHHLVIVEAINNDGTMWVSEMNAAGQASMTDPTPVSGWSKVDYRMIPTETIKLYVP